MCLVIGGTGGVGSECVRTFHNHGAKVVFIYNSNKDEATKIVDELNGKVSAIQLDLSNENSVKKSLSEINQSNPRNKHYYKCCRFQYTAKIYF